MTGREQAGKIIMRFVIGLIVSGIGAILSVSGVFAQPSNVYQTLVGLEIILIGLAITQDKIDFSKIKGVTDIKTK